LFKQDPNGDDSLGTGYYNQPFMTNKEARRSGSLSHLKECLHTSGDKLTVWSNTYVTKVLLEGKENTAIGVEYSQQKSYYSADPRFKEETSRNSELKKVYVNREVIG
jgi:hypothetical protein